MISSLTYSKAQQAYIRMIYPFDLKKNFGGAALHKQISESLVGISVDFDATLYKLTLQSLVRTSVDADVTFFQLIPQSLLRNSAGF